MRHRGVSRERERENERMRVSFYEWRENLKDKTAIALAKTF